MDSFSSNRKSLLLSAIKKGDIESFWSLYKTYQPKIFAFSLRYLKVTEAAEDLTQEVFIQLWENRQKININFSLSSFLFTIAKNKIIDHFRKQQRQTLFNNYIQHYLEFPNTLKEENEGNNVASIQVESVINKLPEKRKIVFLLSKKFGLNRREIADFLGISENTVKNQLQEALKFLRHVLHQETVLTFIFFISFLK